MKDVVVSYLFPTLRAIEDQPTNKWSYIDAFTIIKLPEDVRFLYQSFYIVGKVKNLPIGEIDGNVTIYKPDNKVLSTIEIKGSVSRSVIAPNSNITDVVVFFQSIRFEDVGTYRYSLTVGNNKFNDARYTFEVV